MISPLGTRIKYRYDGAGRREGSAYPDGSAVGCEYNAAGKLSRVLSDAGVTGYSYDMAGRPVRRTLPDGTETSHEYNPLGAPASLTHVRDGMVLDGFRYAYDPAGNIKGMERHRGGLGDESGLYEYTYDNVGRLSSVVKGEMVKRYRYDERGNRVREWGDTNTTRPTGRSTSTTPQTG